MVQKYVLLDGVNIRLLMECGPYTLSDDILFAHDSMGVKDIQEYTKVKEINVGYLGGQTIRVAFTIGCDTAHNTHGRLWKNGVDTTLEGNNGGDFFEYKFDLAVELNDVLELRVFNDDPGFPVKYKNFRILGKYPIPEKAAIIY